MNSQELIGGWDRPKLKPGVYMEQRERTTTISYCSLKTTLFLGAIF